MTICSVLTVPLTIGDNCNINCHVFVEDEVVIKNNVTVKSGVQLWNGVVLEETSKEVNISILTEN